MNTTAQGDTYENKVLKLVKRLIQDGTVAVGKNYKVYQKKSYPIDFGTDYFTADISVETTNPHCNNQISNLIIFECKDLNKKLDKSDFEEWRGRIQNLPYGKKLYFVTSKGYTQPIIEKAINTGVGLIVWNGQGDVKWEAPRMLNEIEFRNYNYKVLRGDLPSPSYPLVFENVGFYTFGEMLVNNNLPFNIPKLKTPFLSREEIKKIVCDLINNSNFYSIPTPKNEDKLITFLKVKISFEELPANFKGSYNATENCIILPNWMISKHELLRFSLAHELGHAYLHRETLRQYESFYSNQISSISISESEFQRFDIQANDFASYLLMPDIEFKNEVSILFKKFNLHHIPFIIDHQKGKFAIYYTIIDALATKFSVSKEHVKTRLNKDNFVEIKYQPNRIGNILRNHIK